MAEDLFGSFAGISSFNAGGDNNEGDSWLVKQNGMLLGPMPTSLVNNKLLSGEIKSTSLIAPEGSDEFNPIRQVALFKNIAIQAEQLMAKKAAKKRTALIGGLTFAVVALAGSFLYLDKAMGWEIVFKKPAPVAEAPKKLSLDDIPTLKLVSLADIEKAVETMTVRDDPKEEVKEEPKEKVAQAKQNKPKKPKTSTAGVKKAAAADDDDEVVATCQLDTKVIMGVVQRSAGKWVSCIQNLAQTEPNLVPAKLVLSFTVTPAGKLTNFVVGNRELRNHPVRNCLYKQFTAMSFPASKGTNCNVDNWTIPLKK